LIDSGATFAFTALHVLERRNAFKLGIFRKLLTSAEAAAAWRNVERDLRSGRLVRQPVKWPSVLRLAARLSEQYSSIYGTRSLDIVHVATAKLSRLEEFVSFDSRQRNLALAIGLKVGP
jgi:predicted nucleic acid-binding protein